MEQPLPRSATDFFRNPKPGILWPKCTRHGIVGKIFKWDYNVMMMRSSCLRLYLQQIITENFLKAPILPNSGNFSWNPVERAPPRPPHYVHLVSDSYSPLLTLIWSKVSPRYPPILQFPEIFPKCQLLPKARWLPMEEKPKLHRRSFLIGCSLEGAF